MSREHDAHFTAMYVAQAAKRSRWTTAGNAYKHQEDTAVAPRMNSEPGNPERDKRANPDHFTRLCRAAGLPEPVAEYRFHSARRWRFDYAWPAHLLALEIEGGIWTQGRHTRGSGAAADLAKYSEAAILGWRLLYVQPDEIATVGIEYVRRALRPVLEAA